MLAKVIDHNHALLIPDVFDSGIVTLTDALAQNGMTIQGNPDIIIFNQSKFGIDDARDVIVLASSAPVQESKKRIVIAFDSITVEAQNALLKVLEDPSPQSAFVLIHQNYFGLIPTLRSRLLVVTDTVHEQVVDITNFLSESIAGRMKYVESLVKDYKDSGNKKPIEQFLLALHNHYLAKAQGDTAPLSAIDTALEYINDKSSSVKILLESMVLAI